jgi:hypothetical protein
MAKKFVLLFLLLPGVALPQLPLSRQEEIRRNPNYSEAIANHQDPHDWLRQQEAKYADATSRGARVIAIWQTAKAAIEAGEIERAEKLANEALDLASTSHRMDSVMADGTPLSYSGNAEYWGHTVLGRVALSRGDVDTAKKEVLRAGQTSGSAFLSSHPNMSLARELLLRGEYETVLEFFAECRRFWKRQNEKLDGWVADVTVRRMPDFDVLDLVL